MGLKDDWVRNIMHCVESSCMVLLWNEEKLDWFCPGRGIRQSDALSPYLFALCMERLSHVIYKEVLEGC